MKNAFYVKQNKEANPSLHFIVTARWYLKT